VQVYKLASQNTTAEKREFIKRLGSEKCVAIGNGANDTLMLREAVLGICVLGTEGTAISAMLSADIVVRDIKDALDLFLLPKRLVATLRR
jgi:soluble P-type ATPase